MDQVKFFKSCLPQILLGQYFVPFIICGIQYAVSNIYIPISELLLRKRYQLSHPNFYWYPKKHFKETKTSIDMDQR